MKKNPVLRERSPFMYALLLACVSAVFLLEIFSEDASAKIFDVQLINTGGLTIKGQVDTDTDTLIIDSWTNDAGARTWTPVPSSLPWNWPAVTGATCDTYDIPEDWDCKIGSDWGFVDASDLQARQWEQGTWAFSDLAYAAWGGDPDAFNRCSGYSLDQTRLGRIPTGTNSVSQVFINTVSCTPPSSGPAFDKAFSPDSIAYGGTSTLTFTIDNTGNATDADSLDFTDNLPAGVTVADRANASTTCTGGTLTAVAGADSIGYTGGTVSAGASCTVQADVTSATSGDHDNTTGDLTSSLGNSGTASDTLTVYTPLAFAKEFSPDAMAPGGTSTLTFSIQNTESVGATALDFTDNLPAGVVVADPANASTDCDGGTLTAVAGSSVISYTGGSVWWGEGGFCTVQVDVTSSTPGDHNNISGDLTSSLGNSGTASDTLTVYTPLGFAKEFSPDAMAPGGTSTLTFSIQNTESVGATALDFTDNLPAGVVVADPANASTDCDGGTLTAVVGSSVISYTGGSVWWGEGGFCTVQVDVTSSTPGDHNNISGDLTSSLGNSGTASDTLAVYSPPGFSKAFSPGSIAYGGTSTLTFTIDNSGSLVDATGLDFTDDLPTGVTVADPANASSTCTGGTLTAVAGSDSIAYTGGTAGAGASCTVKADVTSTTSGDHANTSGDLTSSLGNSGTASDSLTVTAAVAPGFSKAFSPDAIDSGGTSTLTFTIDNSGSLVDATSLDFTDDLPTGVTVADPANASTTCTGGTLNATAGSAAISYTGGNAAAGSTCTVQADVTSTTSGDHKNTSGDLTSSLGNSGTASDTLTVADVPPGFSKAFSPDAIDYGGTSTLTFTIDNTGSLVDATSLDFTDDLPTGVTVADPANASTTCTGGTLTATAGSDSISYTDGTVAGGANCTVQADVTSTTAGIHTNETGKLTSSLGDSGTASALLTVGAQAPTATAATNIEETSFSANWDASTGADGYYLDVARDSGFTDFVTGFNNKDVGDVTTFSVTGLSACIEYFYRLRAYNGREFSLVSADSNTVTLTTTDGTGVPDPVQDAVPNNGDGNGDGTLDHLQTNVASLPAADAKGSYLTVATSGGCNQLQNVAAVAYASVGEADPGYEYPYDLVEFDLPCNTATVRIYYHGAAGLEGYVYRKYGPTPADWATAVWYDMPGVTFGSKKIGNATVPYVEFVLTEAQLGDDTPVFPIIDQGGLAAVTNPVIPTLNEWGMMVLALVIIGMAVFIIRRRKIRNGL